MRPEGDGVSGRLKIGQSGRRGRSKISSLFLCCVCMFSTYLPHRVEDDGINTQLIHSGYLWRMAILCYAEKVSFSFILVGGGAVCVCVCVWARFCPAWWWGGDGHTFMLLFLFLSMDESIREIGMGRVTAQSTGAPLKIARQKNAFQVLYWRPKTQAILLI